MIPREVVAELFAALKGAEREHEMISTYATTPTWERLQVTYLHIIARGVVTLLASQTRPEGT